MGNQILEIFSFSNEN